MSNRPFVLDPLFASVQTLPGVGPRSVRLYEKLCGPKISDLLWHLPTGIIDRRFSPKVVEAPQGRIATFKVSIDKHIPNPVKNRPYRVKTSDDTGILDIVFFHPRKNYIETQLPIGETRLISGKVEYYNGIPQITHPDLMGPVEEQDIIQTVEPTYALTAGLNQKPMQKAMRAAIVHAPSLKEWVQLEMIKRENWPDWQGAVIKAHTPENQDDLDPNALHRRRMAYDELLANQLALFMVRNHNRKQNGRAYLADPKLLEKARAAIPFTLTGAQDRSIQEISDDMAEPARMLRLLQGDVGAGKTIVAFFAALNAISIGAQAAIMAPTEILAKQHGKSITELAHKIGIETVTLTGKDKGKARKEKLALIADGTAQIIIGTHALFQKDVEYHDLGLAIIDEQHRFGVQQRLQLSDKGKGVDVLVMTATPIPRTLTLSQYGDMDFSKLDEKPAGRQPIDTRMISTDRMEPIIAGLGRKIADGERVYWVCPLVEESEIMDLAAAEERFEMLKTYFPGKVGLVHGKMKADEKEEVMQAFSTGAIDILVATTVIEVGVDVPDATIMVIEHAERFGLSQLHQLRGRVGRGAKASTCILLYAPGLGKTSQSRLQTIRDTEDGFVIAEADLALRGAGEILGTRQSGNIDFTLADLQFHHDLLQMARDDAKWIMDKDPELTSERGEALRVLLYLFERDHAIKFLRSG